MANFFILVKNENKRVGFQNITIDEKSSKNIVISSKEPNSPHLEIDIEKGVLSVECPSNSTALSSISGIPNTDKYKTADGKYEFPIKSVNMDGKENFSFEIDGFNYTFNIDANNFFITDEKKQKTLIAGLSTAFFDVTLSQDIFANLNLSKKMENLPKINTRNLPIQILDYIKSTPELLKAPYNASVLQIGSINLLKLNDEFLIARGNTLSPLANSKNVELSTFFAESENGYIATFGMSINQTGNIVDAVGVKNLSEEQIKQLQNFLGHSGKILTSEEFGNLKIHPKNLVVYKQTTKTLNSNALKASSQSFAQFEQNDDDVEQDPTNSALPIPANEASFTPKKKDETPTDSSPIPEIHSLTPPNFEQQLESFDNVAPSQNPEESPSDVDTTSEGKENNNADAEEQNTPSQPSTPPPSNTPTGNVQRQEQSANNNNSKKKTREQALKLTGSLTKLLGFALVMMSLGPASYALCAVGFFLFFSGYVSTDVVDIVESILNFAKGRRNRTNNRQRNNNQTNERTNEQSNEQANEQANEMVNEQEESSVQQIPEQDQQEKLSAKKERPLLTGDKRLKKKNITDFLKNERGEEIFDEETNDLFGQVEENGALLNETAKRNIESCSDILKESENNLKVQKQKLKTQISRYNELAQSESAEDKLLAEEIKLQIVESRKAILNAEQVLKSEKEEMETILTTEIKENAKKVISLTSDAENLVTSINSQENDLIKEEDGTISYDNPEESKNRKRQKNVAQNENDSRQILEDEIQEETAQEQEKIQQEIKREKLAENKQNLKEKLKEIVTEQERVIVQNQSSYEKLHQSIQKIKAVFSIFTKTQEKDQNM